MKGAIKGLSLLVVGSALGEPLPVQAQAVTWKELVGSWTEVAMPMKFNNVERYIYHRMTFRSDSSMLETHITAHTGLFESDTVACTTKWKVTSLEDGKLKVVGSTPVSLKLENQQLSMGDVAGKAAARVFRRVDPSKEPFAPVIAAGFVTSKPIPTRPKTPTGTLADMVGVWEKVPKPGEDFTEISIYRPDSTRVGSTITKRGEDQLVCGYAMQWGTSWQRKPGDSLITNPRFPKWKITIDKQLSSFMVTSDEGVPQATYKAKSR